ncbi:MAG: M28 family peptidase [Kiritimatiellaeota bacterium]|nr:M28 family peptidase [Kiritimatiellota bacterium]
MEKLIPEAILRILLLLAVLICPVTYMVSMPSRSFSGPLPPLTSEESQLATALEGHVRQLAGKIGGRSVTMERGLAQAVTYVASQFSAAGFACRTQTFEAFGVPCRNLDVENPGSALRDEIVVIGAHYDSVLAEPAANDNASGVAALLELARLCAGTKPARTLRFVAFVNEEPPYFQTEQMGSLVYARACKARGERITAMLSLETMGCYLDAEGSQHYPHPFNLLYPSRGNFIGFIGNLGSRALVRQCIGSFRAHTQFPSEGGALPTIVPGVGWSDHWAFWQVGYPAILVTDTATFRDVNYHQDTDTPEKLDYARLARVTIGLREVIKDLTQP